MTAMRKSYGNLYYDFLILISVLVVIFAGSLSAEKIIQLGSITSFDLPSQIRLPDLSAWTCIPILFIMALLFTRNLPRKYEDDYEDSPEHKSQGMKLLGIGVTWLATSVAWIMLTGAVRNDQGQVIYYSSSHLNFYTGLFLSIAVGIIAVLNETISGKGIWTIIVLPPITPVSIAIICNDWSLKALIIDILFIGFWAFLIFSLLTGVICGIKKLDKRYYSLILPIPVAIASLLLVDLVYSLMAYTIASMVFVILFLIGFPIGTKLRKMFAL